MINKNHAAKLLVVIVATVFLGLIIFSGCTDEKEVVRTETVTVHDTVTVTITMTDTVTIVINNVSVDTVLVNPDSITVGKSVMLTANVSTQPGVGPILFTWSANSGTFDSQTGDTVMWTAPDDAGVYMIKVIAEDGTYSGIATRMIGVGMYVPTLAPYYVGGPSCACHGSEVVTPWEVTAHAHAWQTLQESGHPAEHCNPCHATGWRFDLTDSSFVSNEGDAGFDEAPIENYVNAQCEACHGPASTHTSSMSADDIEVDWDVMNCGKCHDGTHHPFLTEWRQSPHNFNPRTGSCEGCHEGVASAYRLSGDLSNFYGGGSVSGRPDTTKAPLQPANCQTCHDPHDAANPGQLRTVADVPLVTANGESPVIAAGGVGKLCMHCHHARRGPESQIQNGYAHFGPHANPQADMLKAKSAYHAVADPSFPWVGPSHLLVENSCKTCHLATREFGGGPGGAAVVGHEFIPKPEACVGCHGPITDFDDIMALEDFDGDGTVEGVQSEVQGLMHLLEDALIADGLDTTGVGFAGALGDTLLSTYEQREAGYNLIFLEDDKSLGVHNPDYAVQLLQQSILYINGTLPANAKIVKNDAEVVGMW